MAAGGDAIARDAGGRVVFVAGALPGETVRAELVEERRDFARARVVEVVSPSPDRIAPPCPNALAGCGGCAWQHVAPDAQLGLKAAIVADALRRIASLAPPEPRLVPLPEVAQRTTLRLAVVDGRAAYRRRQEAGLVEVEDCLVAHPRLAELLAVGRFGAAREVTLRAGAATGDRLVVADPRAEGVRVPDDTVVVGVEDARRGAAASVTEVVAGRRWRVSALSFFQSGPVAAEVLAAEVVGRAAPALGSGTLLADLYAGVGLLGGAAVAAGGGRLVAVESNRHAAGDAEHNLADLEAQVVRVEVGRWRTRRPVDVVVADPARTGLGRPGVAAIVRAGAPLVVLVSCDPASLARDAALLRAEGYALGDLSVVDAFPGTPHVETVTSFVTNSGGTGTLGNREVASRPRA